jgi:hypothetical protein
VELLPACKNASLQPPSSYAITARNRSPAQSTVTGAARELSGPKDNPRSSRSRFRGCRRSSQIHHPTSHAVLMSTMGWRPQDLNLPAQAVFLDSGHEKSIHSKRSQRGSASYLSSRHSKWIRRAPKRLEHGPRDHSRGCCKLRG